MGRQAGLAAALLLGAIALVAVATTASAKVVAVGFNGVIVSSTDGVNWSPEASGTSAGLLGIAAYGNNWVTVGSGGTILTNNGSPTWFPRPSGTVEWLQGVATDGTTWVAVGTNGVILRSTDAGTTWTPSASGTTQNLNAVWSDGTQWIAVGAGPGYTRILTSPNAIAWTTQVALGPGAPQLHAIAAGGGAWVAVGEVGNRWTSTTGGVSWPTATSGGSHLYAVRHNGALWLAMGGQVRTSLDAVTWTAVTTTGLSSTQFGLAWCHDSFWVAVSNGGSIFTNPGPASAWTSTVSGTPENLRAVACVPQPLSCLPAGQTVLTGTVFAMSAGGGTQPYSWSAPGSNNPGPIAGASFSAAFPSSGTRSVTLSDAGGPMQSTTCSVTVVDPPPPTCSPASQTVYVGGVATLNAGAGTGSYSWSAPGGSNPGSSGSSFSTTFPAQGTQSVTVTDAGPPVQSATCIVDVVPPPATCAADPRAAFSVSAADPVAGQSITFQDTSTDATERSWDFGDGFSSQEPGPVHAFSGPGTYHVRLSVTAPACGVSIAEREVTVAPSGFGGGAVVPLADAGPDQVVTAGVPVRLAGNSDPADGVTFTWIQTEGPQVALEGADTATPAFTAPGVGPTRLAFALRVRDGGATSAPDEVSVLVLDANRPPVAMAGPVATAAAGATVTLDGSNSMDPDGQTLSYAWRQLAGPTVELRDARTAVAAATIPAEAVGEELLFELVVDDGQTVSADAVRIIVLAPAPAPAAARDPAPAPVADMSPQAAAAVPSWVVLALAAGGLALAAFVIVAVVRRQGGRA